MFDHILVPLGGSRFAELALPHAMAVASRWGATLELLTVAEAVGGPRRPGSVPGEAAREEGVTRGREYLDSVEERLRTAGFARPVERTVIAPGHVSSSIVRHVAGGPPDFVVMTTHGRGPLHRAWLGSVADGVIRQTPTPVLLVRPEEDQDEEPEPVDLAIPVADIKRALIPLDGSPAAEKVVPLTGPLLAADATITLFQSIPPVTPGAYPYLPHAVREERQQEEVRQAARSYLEGVAEDVREEGWTVEVAVTSSHQTAMAILEAVQEREVQLISMSTEGRGGVTRLLLGSVADKVIRGSPVPVLVYREPGSD